MTHPPKSTLLLLLLLLAMLSSCFAIRKDGKGIVIQFMTPSPLLIARTSPTPPIPAPPIPAPPIPAPPDPAPDETLYDPTFEDAEAVVGWARPVAPEGAFNAQFTPDGQMLLYLAHHPGTRWTSLYGIPLAGGEPILLATATMEEEIFYFAPTADSERVIYYQPFQGDGLHSVTLDGTKKIELTRDKVWEMAVSPDGQWVVYWAENTAVSESNSGLRSVLYRVPAAGGIATQLGQGIRASGTFKITPDSRYVLFLASETLDVDAPLALYRVPIQGGIPLQLSQLGATATFGNFLVTPDSQSVIFGNLYHVSIDGGPTQQLNPFAAPNRPEFPFSSTPQLSPNGEWVLFLNGDQRGDDVLLYGAPLEGGAARQLNGPLAAGESVQGFFVSLDGERVFYWQGKVDQERGNTLLYSVPLAGGEPVTLPEWYWVRQSEDGQWLIYGTKLESAGFDLYSIPSAGGAPVKLNGPVPTNSAVAYAGISPDSRTVFYVTSKDAGGGMPVFDGLYQIPIEGGEAREITGVDGQDRLDGFSFAPDGQTLIVGVDYDGDGRSALYAFATEPAPAPEE